MRLQLSLIISSLLMSCGDPAPEQPTYSMPPEWESHEAVWFTYAGEELDTVLDKMVLALDSSTLAVCATDNDELAASLIARFDSLGIARERYRMEVMGDSLFVPAVRDAGPIFLRMRDGGLAVLDPDWNYYGDHDNVVGFSERMLAYEDSFPSMIAHRMGLPVVHSDMVIEGGALEVNGNGVVLQVEAVTMQRNPGWSKDSMETELRRVLGVQDIIWLKQGPTDDMWYLEPRIHGNVFNQGTGGHVDEFCRFVNDSTVLLGWPDDADLSDSTQLITRQRMEVNLGILEQFRDRSGRPLHVVKVPTPDTEYRPHAVDTARSYDRMLVEQYDGLRAGDTVRYIPAASYLNLLITNGRVFVPAYWRMGMPLSMKAKDERVRKILAEYFPNRTIVQLDPRAINRRGGGMHCWTQQQPVAIRR